MTLSHTALRKKAVKLELKESKKIRFDPPFISVLEVMLLDVYGILRPRPSDYEQRRHLVQLFTHMAKDIFGSSNGFPIMEAFGSFIMDLFTARSDLDLSLNFSNDYTTDFPRDKKISVLRKFAKSLYARQARGHVSGVLPVTRARVPVLKVVDCQTGIECDISVENKDGISRSSILTVISSMDERFRILSYLMKIWARAHDINSSKDRTMNSLTIISLVAFHLQTRDPPILPPFSALFKDGTDALSIQNALLKFRHSNRRNEESVSKLFVALLNQLSSVESLWQHGLCASTYDGSWISKTWEKGIANLSVEDFLDQSQNFARSVGKVEMQKINNCIQSSLSHLSCFMKGQIEASQLKTFLFGSISSSGPIDQHNPREGVSLKRRFPFHGSDAAPVDHVTMKRAHYTEVTGGLHHAHYETSANNSSPTSFIPRHPSFAPFQPSYRVHHLGPPVPSQSGDALQYHPQPSIAPYPGYGPQHPQLPRHPQLPQHPRFQFASHLGYQSEHQQLPAVPSQFYYGRQHHQDGQNLMFR